MTVVSAPHTEPPSFPDEVPHSNPAHWPEHWRMFAFFLAVGVTILLIALGEFDITAWARDVARNLRHVSLATLALALVVFTVGELLSIVPWTAALRAAYPDNRIAFKSVFAAIETGGLINAFAPAKAGTIIRLLLLKTVIRESSMATLVSVSLLIAMVYGCISVITMAALIVYQGPAILSQVNYGDDLAFFQGHPILLLSSLLVVLLVALYLYHHFQERLGRLKQEVVRGAAVARQSDRFILFIVVPAAFSYLARLLQMAIFMHAFHIPVSIESVSLLVIARQISGGIAISPGGIGTRQAIDVVALQSFASANAVISFSIAQNAITKLWTIVIAVLAMIWGFGLTDSLKLWKRRTRLISAGKAELGELKEERIRDQE